MTERLFSLADLTVILLRTQTVTEQIHFYIPALRHSKKGSSRGKRIPTAFWLQSPVIWTPVWQLMRLLKIQTIVCKSVRKAVSIAAICLFIKSPFFNELFSKDSLGHTEHVQTGHPGGSAQAGRRGSRGCAAADPADTSDGFLKHTCKILRF